MLRSAFAIALIAVPLAAGAQSYRCVGKDGKKYYGQTIPSQCLGLPVEQLNAQGIVVKRFDAQATADERAKKETEEAERKKREAISKEEGRRNRALLATYTSEKDVEEARARALKENQIAVKEIEARIAALKKRHAGLAKEIGAAQTKGTPQPKLNEDLKNAEIDLKAQEGLLAAKKQDVDAINARYDEHKKRYVELTKGGAK